MIITFLHLGGHNGHGGEEKGEMVSFHEEWKQTDMQIQMQLDQIQKP